MCTIQISIFVTNMEQGPRQALSIHTQRRHSLDSTNNPEIEDNDHSKKIEELKVKLVLSRTIDGLEKSFVPNEELSTKLVYMMD